MFERFIDTDEIQTLPRSSDKITLSITGQVFVCGNEVIPRRNNLGDLVVQIEWLGEFKEYTVALLMAHAFKPLFLSSKWWKNITVIFADSNKDNIHPSNLVWKFPVGFGADSHNGFAFIPMYSRYMINKEGTVFDTYTHKLVYAHFNKGYYSFTLKPDVGHRTSLKRHRGILLAFTDYPANVDSMTVNHINSTPGDDRLENLEWLTYSENRIHGIISGNISVNKPVIVRDLITGKEDEYFSLNEVCKKLKLSERAVSHQLGKQNGKYVKENLELSYKNPEHAFLGTHNKVPILVRDFKTDVITEYESINSCAEQLGLTMFTVSSRLQVPRTLFPDYLQFRRKTDMTPWYVPKDYEKELLERSWRKTILVRNAITKEVVEYGSQREATAALGIGESTIVNWVQNSGQSIYRDEKTGNYIQIKRKNDLTPWRDSENPEEEYRISTGLKPVLVKNVLTNQVIEYPGANVCAREMGLLTTTLNWRLKSKGQKLYPGGFQFKYQDEPLNFADVDPVIHSIISFAPVD